MNKRSHCDTEIPIDQSSEQKDIVTIEFRPYVHGKWVNKLDGKEIVEARTNLSECADLFATSYNTNKFRFIPDVKGQVRIDFNMGILTNGVDKTSIKQYIDINFDKLDSAKIIISFLKDIVMKIGLSKDECWTIDDVNEYNYSSIVYKGNSKSKQLIFVSEDRHTMEIVNINSSNIDAIRETFVEFVDCLDTICYH